jgi:putative transposase
MKRKIILTTNELYHIYNKSIYGFVIFNTDEEFERMRAMIFFYQWKHKISFCRFLESRTLRTSDLWTEMALFKERHDRLVEIVAYCLMPTHIHFILKQIAPDGISLFTKKLLGGYTLYFNYRHNRRGPLWQSRFGSRLIENDRDLLATSLYVHGNPVKDLNLPSPGDWKFSSFLEHQGQIPLNHRICTST